MSIDLVLLIAAIVCLLLATFGVSHPRVNLVALGLALFVLTFVV